MFSVPIVKVVSRPTLAHCLVVGIAGFQPGARGRFPVWECSVIFIEILTAIKLTDFPMTLNINSGNCL